jgi:hypothetical protein
MAVEPDVGGRIKRGAEGTVCRLGVGEAGIERPSVAVAEAVAGVRGEALAPGALNAAVDPDALDDLFAARATGAERADGVVSFEVADCVVTLYGDGTVTAARLD